MIDLPGPVLAALIIGAALYFGAIQLVHGVKAIDHKVVAGVHKIVHPHKK